MQIKTNKPSSRIFPRSTTSSQGSLTSIATINASQKNKEEILSKPPNYSKCLKEDYKPHRIMRKVPLNTVFPFLIIWNQINKIHLKKNKYKN